jgi:uroporphyrinogen III methyltransferase / synthase
MTPCETPLAGKRVVLACSEMKSAALASGLELLGAELLVFPVISLREIADKSALDVALGQLDDYSWIIFTSAYAVRLFLRRMAERGITPDGCRNCRICAIGPATAAALESSGLPVSLMPADFVAEGILTALAQRLGGLSGLKGLRILLPRARDARDVIPKTLAGIGARVDMVPCYENALPQVDGDRVQALVQASPNLLVFTSSSTVRNFAAILGGEHRKVLLSATVAALGPITARTVASFGKDAEIVPGKSTVPALLDAIRLYYRG